MWNLLGERFSQIVIMDCLQNIEWEYHSEGIFSQINGQKSETLLVM